MSSTAVAPLIAGPSALVERSVRFKAMGGWVSLRVAGPAGTAVAADRDLRLAAARIGAWADRITRFDARSELCRLNGHARASASLVGPSLGDLLARARDLSRATDGLVDVTRLEARLAAESGGTVEATDHDWWLEPVGRRYLVHREGHVAFDLDGVGKGWIADRALALLARYPMAMVDADGDIAMRQDGHADWGVAIADPRRGDADLARIAAPPDHTTGRMGIATSGTTVHRWEVGGGWAHHLIDPRTGGSADTDVVQATVVAGSALEAEALAKSVVIAGPDEGFRLVERSGARAAFVLLGGGELVAAAGSEAWLA